MYHDCLSQLYPVWALVKVLVKVPEVLHAVGLLQVFVSLKLHTEEGAVGGDVGGGDMEDHTVPDNGDSSATVCIGDKGIWDSCGGGDEDGGGEEIERVMMEMVGISVNPLRADNLFYTKTISAEINFSREKDINWHRKF